MIQKRPGRTLFLLIEKLQVAFGHTFAWAGTRWVGSLGVTVGRACECELEAAQSCELSVTRAITRAVTWAVTPAVTPAGSLILQLTLGGG